MAAQTSGRTRPLHRRRVSGKSSRRPRDLDLRRTRQGRHDPSRLPQHGADDRPLVRRAPRPGPSGGAHDADRHRDRRLHPQVLQGIAKRRRARRRTRRDCRVGAGDLWLGGSKPRLQGRVPGYARGQRRLLRALRRERASLVQEGQRRGVLRQPRDRQSARRSRQAARRSQGRVHARRGGDRRRPRRQRRQGRGDDVDAHALQLHRQQRCASHQDEAVRLRLHGADGCARA